MYGRMESVLTGRWVRPVSLMPRKCKPLGSSRLPQGREAWEAWERSPVSSDERSTLRPLRRNGSKYTWLAELTTREDLSSTVSAMRWQRLRWQRVWLDAQARREAGYTVDDQS
jgi:hypothetical protein